MDYCDWSATSRDCCCCMTSRDVQGSVSNTAAPLATVRLYMRETIDSYMTIVSNYSVHGHLLAPLRRPVWYRFGDVCLSVCLFAILRQNFCIYCRENRWTIIVLVSRR